MTDCIGVRKLSDFLIARQMQSGVSIDAGDTELLAQEIQGILARVETLDEILASYPDIIAQTYHD